MMKFYKSDDKNRYDLTPVSLKILTMITQDENWGVTEEEDIEYNLEFEVESIKGITMIETDKKGKISILTINLEGQYRMYVTLKYLPKVFKLTKKWDSPDRNRYENDTQRGRSPLWNDNLLKN